MTARGVITALSMTILFSVAASQAQPSHNSKGLPGTYVVTVNFEGESFKVLQSFTRDGRSTTLLPFGPPCCNDTRVGGLGEWIKTGPRDFDVTMFFFASVYTLEPLQRSRLKLKLDPNRDTFSGPFRFDITDKDGNVLFSDDGTFTGERLKGAPMNE